MIRQSLIALVALSLLACRQGAESSEAAIERRAPAPVLTTQDAVDIHSYAKPLEARVTHLALDLVVDFPAKRVGGTATLDVEAKPGVGSIVLDNKGLEIAKVADGEGEPLAYSVGAADPNLGAPLTVKMGDARKIVITYKSAPDASALQWLTPEQTAGKKHPFLLSQGQAIENRSWIPTQDSPGIRQSWEAKISVPAPLTAVMSAPKSAEPVRDGDRRVFSYRMDNPVAPYLIAIAVGDLAFRDLGPRTGVWAEPSVIDSAAAELADTEKMVSAAEALFGPYRWGRYDMIVLPPSFPFGGMENPTLTFLTPTFIAGDKSLVSLIAHELAHSWSGNLATNATWADFWLNEGMTTYATYRIVESIYGPKVAAQQLALGRTDLEKAIAEHGGQNGPDTRLHLDLKGRHPDDGLTDIAYEKGAAFLRMIESVVGREKFDAYMRSWFDRHAFEPVTSAMFLADIRDKLVKGDAALEEKLKLDEWVYQPGLPSNAVPADPAAFAEVDRANSAFASGAAADSAAWQRWNTSERLRFLNQLPQTLSDERMAELDRAFGLSDTRNNEVKFVWLKMVVANQYQPGVPALEQFLSSIGRRKFVRPLITALAEDPEWGRPIAARLYPKVRSGYHPITTRDLDELGIGGPQ